MAKAKIKAGIPSKHIHARISYLQQAARYLALHRRSGPVAAKIEAASTSQRSTAAKSMDGAAMAVDQEKSTSSTSSVTKERAQRSQTRDDKCSTTLFDHDMIDPLPGGLPRYLLSHSVQVARKSQIRIHSNLKQSMCRRCNMPLIDAETCEKRIENLSRGERKPHADVLVVKCLVCQASKRFPIGGKRQSRKTKR